MSTSQRAVILCAWGVKAGLACLQVKVCVVTSFRFGKCYLYINIGSVCPSVCATVSASINPLPSDRLRCCDRCIRCQRSLAVKPLNSRPAMYIALQLLACAMTVSKLMYAWCQLTQWDFPDCNGPGVLECGLWLACAALLRLTPQATIAQSAIVACNNNNQNVGWCPMWWAPCRIYMAPLLKFLNSIPCSI